MSAARELIDQLLDPEVELRQRIQTVLNKSITLSLPFFQEFIRDLSFVLYQKQSICTEQLVVLQFLKSLLLTATFPSFLLMNVYIFPWILSLNALHKSRTINKRAQLLYKDAVGLDSDIDKEGVQSYLQLLQFTGQFLVFFGQNFKFHPFSKYKIKNCLTKELQNGSYSRSLEYFIEKDMLTLQHNLKKYNAQFKEDVKQLTEFLSQVVEQCLTEPTKYQECCYLLLSLIQISESYCITAIIYRTCRYLTPEYVLTSCQFLHSVISLAELQSIEIINSKCLPLILQYLLPIDFKNNEITNRVRVPLESGKLNRLIDYYYLWYDKTKLAGLSTKIYEYSYDMITWLKKPSKLIYQQQIKEFVRKLGNMKDNNETKRSFVIDQNQEIQNYVVNLLKEAEFCLNSQKKQKIAYQNVLDQLTITEKESDRMSQFSESLLRSDHRELEEKNYVAPSKHLQGPPHKKFGQKESSISQIKGNNLKSSVSNCSSVSDNQQRVTQNIYYTRHSPKMPHLPKQSTNKSNIPFPLAPYNISKQRFQHSQRQVYEISAQTVHAKNSTPQKTPVSSPQNSMFLNSSQYSQKENNANKQKISSIYLDQEGRNKDESGDFVHFEKDSLAKSDEDKEKLLNRSGRKEINSNIQFEDSMKLEHSQSQDIREYGMDRAAKVPPSLKKPKFAFKQADTNDSSLILKDIRDISISASAHSQPKNQEKLATPEQSSPLFLNRLKNSSPQQFFPDKRTENTKAAPKSESYKSPSRQSQKLQPIDPNMRSLQLTPIPPNESISEIKELSAEPYAESASGSQSSSNVPSNFGSFFRRTKKQKASSLLSNRSLRKVKLPEKPVEIPDFRKMRDLQTELGKLKQQTENYEKLLTAKSKQKKQLQQKKKKIVEEDPYFLKRENQLIRKMLNKKQSNEDVLLSSHSSAKALARELKESSIKNYNMSLKDYNPNVLKLKLDNIQGYQKNMKKNIVANRCLILQNQLLEIGYSLKGNVVTLYFTLKHHCDSLAINLINNSVIYSQDIQRQFDKILVGKQMKFKTNVVTTKDQNKFIHSVIHVQATYEQKLDKKTIQYEAVLPLTPYNLAVPLQASSVDSRSSQQKESVTHYVTPLYSSCDDLLKKGKTYLQYLFPHGVFDQDSSTFTISYLWKQMNQTIKIKLKQRSFRLQGVGHPVESGRELIESVINMLVLPVDSS